jgi:hypothetical protein
MLISRRLIRSARLIIISVEHVYIPCNREDLDSLNGSKTCLKHIYLETLLLIQMRSTHRPSRLHMHAIHACTLRHAVRVFKRHGRSQPTWNIMKP